MKELYRIKMKKKIVKDCFGTHYKYCKSIIQRPFINMRVTAFKIKLQN